MSADPLDWLNGYSNVPYTESVVWSDQKELDYNPSKTKDQFWMKRWNINPIGPNGGLVYHPHYEPFDLKEIGFAGFWGDYKMDGSRAKIEHDEGKPVKKQRIDTQMALARGYKQAGCNKCGQVIRVRVQKGTEYSVGDSRQLEDPNSYAYDTLAWDMFPGQENAPTCKNCNTAMSFNFKLEKFRKGKYSKELQGRRVKQHRLEISRINRQFSRAVRKQQSQQSPPTERTVVETDELDTVGIVDNLRSNIKRRSVSVSEAEKELAKMGFTIDWGSQPNKSARNKKQGLVLSKKKEKIFDRDINISDDEIGGLPFDEVTRSYAEPMKKIEQPDTSILIDGGDILGDNQPASSSIFGDGYTFNGKKKKKKKGKKVKGIKWI